MEGGVGKKNNVVFGVGAAAESRPFLFRHAYHGEELAFDIEFLADRIGVVEQGLRGVVTENDDRAVLLLLGRDEPAPALRFVFENLGGRDRVAFQNGVLRPPSFVFHHVGSGAEFPAETCAGRPKPPSHGAGCG